MKKILVFAMLLFGCLSVNAQFGGLAKNAAKKAANKTAEKVADKMQVERETVSSSAILGTWEYNSPVFTLKGQGAVENLAMVAGTKELNKALEKQTKPLGFKKGEVKFTFNEDGTFTAELKGKKTTGTYQLSGRTINYTIGLTDLGLDQTISSIAELEGEDLVLQFDLEKIEDFIVVVAGATGGSLSGLMTVANALDGVSEIKGGFKFTKK